MARIDPKEIVEGVRLIAIRDAVNRQPEFITASILASKLKISPGKAMRVLQWLQQQGYIQPHHGQTEGPEHWQSEYKDAWETTPSGMQFAVASARPPLKRAKAEALLAALLERVQQVNASEEYLYKVAKVLVFGSYLSERPEINDVDVAIELAPKDLDRDRHFEATQAQASSCGRRLNFVEKLCFSETKVRTYLKSRSHGLSLHDLTVDRQVVTDGPHHVLYEAV